MPKAYSEDMRARVIAEVEKAGTPLLDRELAELPAFGFTTEPEDQAIACSTVHRAVGGSMNKKHPRTVLLLRSRSPSGSWVISHRFPEAGHF
jgi:hypothetical protein